MLLSRRRRESLHLVFNRDCLWKDSPCEHFEITPQSAPAFLGVPIKSLLDEDRQQLSGPRRVLNFQPKEKKKVAAILARSIVYLYKSPWMQEPCATDNVLFIRDSDESKPWQNKGPYLTCSLSRPDSLMGVDQRDPLHGHPLMVDFGIFLSELESGDKFRPSEEDDLDFETGLFSPFLMLKRILDLPDLRRRVEAGYRDVIKACLNFDELVSALHHPGLNEELRYRAAVFKHILTPLVEELKLRYPDAAEGLLDVPQYPRVRQSVSHEVSKTAGGLQPSVYEMETRLLATNKSHTFKSHTTFKYQNSRNQNKPFNPSILHLSALAESCASPLNLFDGDDISKNDE
jgi:hypothetical protein